MFRSSLCLILGLCLTLTGRLAPAPDLRNVPSSNEIEQAIERLGSRHFKVRDGAKKFLFEAGAVAEPFLEEAAKSTDAEIANSANAILEEFHWGLYPDTPKEIRDRIEEFRSGVAEQRRLAIVGLFGRRPVPFPTILKLLDHEKNSDLRRQMFVGMFGQTMTAMPELLASGNVETAEAMLEFTSSGATELAAPNYAALIYLRKKVDWAIARFEKRRRLEGEDGRRAAEILVYLYRNKGDFANARRAARDSGKDELIDCVLWQAGDWKRLADRADRIPLGLEATYARLAGRQEKFDEKMVEIKSLGDGAMDSPHDLKQCAIALLYNGKTDDAFEILTEREDEGTLIFDLLCAQMKHKEAFELVDKLRRRNPDSPENWTAQLRLARMLYLLGEKDKAIEIFQKAGGDLRKNFGLLSDLIEAEMSVGLRDLAIAHAAKELAPFDRLQMAVDGPKLLKPIFGDDAATAQIWLSVFKYEDSDDVAERVSAIFAGTIDRKKLAEWIDKMLKEFAAADRIPHFDNVDAVAAAYKAIGDEVKANEFLKFAAEKMPTSKRFIAYGDFLMEGKKYKDAAQAYANAAKSPPPAPPRMPPGVRRFYFGADEFHPALATYLSGNALLLAGDSKEGGRLIELAHWLPLGDNALRSKLIELLHKRDWPELAEKEAEMLLKTGRQINARSGNLFFTSGKRAVRRKNYFGAADYYEKGMVELMRTNATLVDPAHHLLLPAIIRDCRTLGRLAKGEIDEAIKEANPTLDTAPGNLELAISLVPDLQKIGKKNEADAIYQRVCRVQQKFCKDYPNSGYAHNIVASFMAICRRDLDLALKHAKRATELEPANTDYLDTLAEVHFRKGDRDAAIGSMKKCVELQPQRAYFRKQVDRFKNLPFDSLTPEKIE